ncbi:thiamine pyrophosphate-binding protein [Mangrovibrevibacter kandeliae]|uniref:thiamine pyrophosphate-binding protein n=1 Tax=Mangrovibrevibacter kandeliae TaxID=2968473 RepID=UPI0021174C5C|nr:thiamine pyrophosphate-binding protein [Aurantimonas sp. CSK15Z-1]
MRLAGGEIVVKALEAQGVDRVFCTPGESYLPVLDALLGSAIETVVCRQEGGAAMMAEADGKLTGRPGIAFVTRGPGATNAASGIHVASHDQTPMILFVGQVPTRFRGRGAFQEVDYDRLFGGMAKAVFEAAEAAELPDLIEQAFAIAMEGASGPVVVALPENALSGEVDCDVPVRMEPAPVPPSPHAMDELRRLLEAAERPVVILGGSRWTSAAVADIRAFAERWSLPVACSFRRQMLFAHDHRNYAGDVGLGISPKLKTRIAEADLVLAVGARLGEVPSQGYTLFDVPEPRQRLVQVLVNAGELGRVYTPRLAIQADPVSFAAAAADLAPSATPRWAAETNAAHRDYLEWSEPRPAETPDFADMSAVMAHLRGALPADAAILTNGAGNYASWLHRFHRFGGYGTQLAPTSGSMGYGLPAAIAAKLRHPDRPVICFAGDGCFQMTGQELGTACQTGAAVVVLIADNGQYGTIRMHQEQRYPGRVSSTGLVNPDFAALAASYGAFAATVSRSSDFPAAFAAALASGRPAVLHLKTDPRQITPARRLD